MLASFEGGSAGETDNHSSKCRRERTRRRHQQCQEQAGHRTGNREEGSHRHTPYRSRWIAQPPGEPMTAHIAGFRHEESRINHERVHGGFLPKPYARPTADSSKSIALMPTNGTISPPSP